MKIKDYVSNNTKAQRQQHIDLNTACIPSVMKNNYRNKKAGEYTATKMGMYNALSMLKEYLNLSGSTSNKIHTCHKCINDSTAPNGFVCTNPKHIYFGTAAENHNDLDPAGNPTGGKRGGKAPPSQKTRNAAAKTGAISGKKQLANGTHNMQQTLTCPHCNKSGIGPAMKRWHFSNCKHAK